MKVTKTKKNNSQARVIWLTGVSGAGKSTLARGLLERFNHLQVPCEILDGDEVRAFFGNDLGYSRQERIANIKRITFAAALLAKNGVNVIVANIAPYFEVRDFIRQKIPDYLQIYVRAAREIVVARDVKGLYKQAKADAKGNMIGIDDAYEEPRHPDLIVETGVESVAESLEKLGKFLQAQGVF